MTPVYALFHLNLAFSSITEVQRPQVIKQCYTPLLDLIETHHLPFGIELTGWTLQQIADIDPAWVARFKRLLADGRCELVGSGYSQMIGPLVPYEVNQWNQRLGLECYQNVLGVRPRLVLVNEMAYSSGMIEVYHEAGYEGLVMDRDNIMLALGMRGQDRLPSSFAKGCDGQQLPVLWSDTVLFQKLQRYAHGDISCADYLDYYAHRVARQCPALPLYSNDAEIFNFRPGRFNHETQVLRDEWQRVASLFALLTNEHDAQWCLPSQALVLQCAADEHEQALRLTSAKQPLPVKKQAKYNISRWAVSGRDDLHMNTRCHQFYQRIKQSTNKQQWQSLCELWASDLRTHIGDQRWHQAQQCLQDLGANRDRPSLALEPAKGDVSDVGFTISTCNDGIYLSIQHDRLALVLNLRRGLSIHSLAFKTHDFDPVIGTLAQGYFDSIQLAADFYSGALVIEMPKAHRRFTDLEWVTPDIALINNGLCVTARYDGPSGQILKTVLINLDDDSVSLGFDFTETCYPHAVVRIHAATLLDNWQTGVVLENRSGGPVAECFALAGEFDHGHAASSMVSCTTGLGGESGQLVLRQASRALKLSWNPAQCAAFPMLYHQHCSSGALSRVMFSLSEIDETKRDGGKLLPFSLKYSAV